MYKSISAFNIKNTYDRSNNDTVTAGLRKSYSLGNCVVEKKRGYKPSDRHDPAKKQFLVDLSKQIWQKHNESSNVSKKIDLHKIFTPATDTEEILPKNRKLYASSAFYSPTLHPTVEDQVELARRISHSLSDTCNQTSKGQSMYVNRKKRSVKWIHEGCGQEGIDSIKASTTTQPFEDDSKEDTEASTESSVCRTTLDKIPLRLLMNPRGQIRDINSIRESINTKTGLLSPDKCAELMTALQTQKGKGAELFAKRRRKAETWIVDDTNAGSQSSSGLPDYHQYHPKPPTSPSIVPAYSDAAKHRLQLNMHQEQVLEKYAKPGLKVVKTPWEAALETGSASAAFVEEQKCSPHHPLPPHTLSPIPTTNEPKRGPSPFAGSSMPDAPVELNSRYDYGNYNVSTNQNTAYKAGGTTTTNSQRELAYKPSVPQGWKTPGMALPKELYIPKEIPLDSYAPPPTVSFKTPPSEFSTPSWKPTAARNTSAPYTGDLSPTQIPSGPVSGFPIGRPSYDGFSVPAVATPPKQQYWEPRSYQKVPQLSNQIVPQVNFNPSPLSYEKIAKFDNPSPEQKRSSPSYNTRRGLSVHSGAQVRNLSPAPFSSGQRYSPAAVPSPIVASNSPFPSSVPQFYDNISTPSSSRLTAGDLLHGENFNNSARGWHSGRTTKNYGNRNTGAQCSNVVSTSYPLNIGSFPVATGSLPYTDF